MKKIQERLQNEILDGNLAGVEDALARGANPNGVHEPFDRRPLHLAATGGNVEIIRALLKAGADPIAEAKFGLSRVRADWIARAMNNKEAASVIEDAVALTLKSKSIGNGEKTLCLSPKRRGTEHRPGL